MKGTREVLEGRGVATGAGFVAALLMTVVAAALGMRSVAAGGGTEGTLRVESATADPGDVVELDIIADVGPPGLGGWAVDVTYNPDLLTIIRCVAYQGGVCSTALSADAGRVYGASATGLIGETRLGTFYFQCPDRSGSTRIELSVETFADNTLNEPQDIDAEPVDGKVICAGEEAGPGIIRIDSRTAVIGGEVTVLLRAEDVIHPPLGAWTADISYDRHVATLVACSTHQGGACVPNPEQGVVRVTGTSARGLTGDFPLALLLFRCADSEGETPLTVELEFFSTAGLTGVPDSEDGTLTCRRAGFPPIATDTATPQPVLPVTGSGSTPPPPLWPLAALAALGGMALAGSALMRRRA